MLKYAVMLIIAITGALSACSDDDSESVEPQVTVVQEEVILNNKAQQKKISIQTNVPLKLVSSESWCTVEQEGETTAKGVATFVVSVESNDEAQERRALIKVYSGETEYGVVSVTQSAGDSIKIVETSPLSVENIYSEIVLTVQTTAEYTVTLSCDWITQKDNAEEGKETFAIKANYDEARTDTIVFSCGNAEALYIITQAAGEIVDLGVESTAKELAGKIFAGINIGNTMEVPLGEGVEPGTSGETGWGNPVINEDYIRGLRNAGFNAVRVPCAWNSHIEDFETFKVSDKWMARVKEVVDMIVNNGMYVILNIHWDGGWLENNCTPNKQEANNKQQKALWTQIANQFKEYDERVLFAGCNEPNAENAEQMAVLATYEQTFVDAVRATGGRNAKRVLIVQGPTTNIEKTDQLMALPTDIVEDRLMVEVHYYDPFPFCLRDKDETWGKMSYFWGSQMSKVSAELKDRCSTYAANVEAVNTELLKMKKKYANQGIPVILGEYGAYYRKALASEEYYDLHKASVDEWLYEVTRLSKNNGLIPFLWDTGALISRKDGSVIQQTQLDNIMKGANDGVYPSIFK
jgi:aryl-phospho-beta-D-glucosidase BglC (GH1 family)